MDNNSTISVTLSADLLTHLRLRAQTERTPLSWLVAGLVCDTIVARKRDKDRQCFPAERSPSAARTSG